MSIIFDFHHFPPNVGINTVYNLQSCAQLNIADGGHSRKSHNWT